MVKMAKFWPVYFTIIVCACMDGWVSVRESTKRATGEIFALSDLYFHPSQMGC